MTPVDDTSTCSGRQLSTRAASAAMVRAAASPSGPVQAFAQPLFTTTAVVVLSDCRKCSFVTISGAATTMFVVNMPAVLAGGAATTNARSRSEVLMPQATPAAANPAGAVTPPEI